MTIQINKVTKKYTEDVILDHITLKINDNEHIGIVGENGCGKSTFLKILAGKENIQEGEIIISKNTKIEYLEQMFPVFDGSVSEYLMSSRSDIMQMQKQMRQIEKEMNQTASLDELLEKYGRLCERFEHAGGYDILYQMDQIAKGLQMAHLMENPYSILSGGEKMRVNLAFMLMKKPDVLLLDEPTNHLDYSGIIWLENYLQSLNKTVVIVSHDRMFLNHTVSKIYEIECAEMIMYAGNYDYYKKEKELRLERLKHDYEEQQKYILKLQNAIRRYRQWADTGDNESFYKKAKQLEKKLFQIEKLRMPKTVQREMKITLHSCERSSKEVLICENICKRFGEKAVLDHADFKIYWQDRIALCGDNGCGKSTFIRILMNRESLDEGEIKIGNHVHIGYLPQVIDFSDEKKRILEYFCYEACLNEEQARRYLRKFGFAAEDMPKRLAHLSGGERVRLKLALILKDKVNFIIFDEPTNHLDFASIEIIESILKEYTGTLLIVSHDRYLMDRLTEQKLLLKNGKFYKQ